MSKRITAGTGISLGALLALPAVAQGDDFTVTNLNDSGAGSLREAILDANANLGITDRVLFQSKLSGEIGLTSGELYVSEPVQILGPGARQLTVDANGDSRVFFIHTDSDVRFEISGLTLTGGSGAAVDDMHNYLTLRNVAVVGNDGTGVNATQTTATIDSSTISGNAAVAGGGGISMFQARVEVVNSTISGNTAVTEGGGIRADSDALTLTNSTVAGNSSGDNGGGIWTSIPDVTFRGTLVADNTADEGDDLYDSGAAVWDSAFSLIEDPGNSAITSSDGNLLGVDPKLKPLKDNGGPTDTHAIKKSPAKNAGPSDAPKSDQRGAPRKNPDIGAYELTKCKGVVVNRVGTSGKDKLKGTKKKDGMLGLGGNDKLKGKKGKDGLCGGRGRDKLVGGPGKDKLDGGPGKDKEVQ